MRPHTKIQHMNPYFLVHRNNQPQLVLKYENLLCLRNGYVACTARKPNDQGFNVQGENILDIINTDTNKIVHRTRTGQPITHLIESHDGSIVFVDEAHNVWRWRESLERLERLERVGPTIREIFELDFDHLMIFYYGSPIIYTYSTSQYESAHTIIEREGTCNYLGIVKLNDSTLRITTNTTLQTLRFNGSSFLSKHVTYMKGEFEPWHKWQYPVKTLDAIYCCTKNDRKEWVKMLTKEFLYLLPELWAIVAMYD